MCERFNDALPIPMILCYKPAYSDDTVLQTEDQEHLQKLLDQVNAIGLTYSTNINTKKTKTLVVCAEQH